MFQKGNTLGTLANHSTSGRKPLYKEVRDRNFHVDLWNHNQNVAKLSEKIASQKYSGRDVIAYLLLVKHNEKIAQKLMDKLIPDLHEVSGQVVFVPALSPDQRKLLANFSEDDNLPSLKESEVSEVKTDVS